MSSQGKGSEFERKMAKTLSLWASEGTDLDLLWRTGMSGGRHTIGALKNHGYGDLQVLKPTPEAIKFMSTFCVELKHYKTFELFTEWFNPKSNLQKWWSKLAEEASNNNVQPMLIVKPNLKPEVIFMDYNSMQDQCRTNPQSYLSKSIQLNVQGTRVIMLLLKDFMELIRLRDYNDKIKAVRRSNG